MQGHIRKRSKGSWTVVVDMGRDHETGKRRQLWRTIKGTKRDAEAMLAQLVHQRNTGIDQPPGKLTLGQYLERWLEDYGLTNLAPKTYRSYADTMQRHVIPALGSHPLTKLRPQHIQAYYSRALRRGRLDGAGGLSAQSVVHHHRALHLALRHAVKWQLLSRNPADAVEPPKAERPQIRTLTPEEAEVLIAAADKTRYGHLVRVALFTGLRQGELLALRWADVDLEAAVLRVQQTVQWLPRRGFVFRQPKTAKSRRAVSLSPQTVQTIRAARQRRREERLKLGPNYEDAGLVFATEVGRPINPSNLRKAWLAIVQSAGLGHLRWHDLRHAHASLLLKQGVHPKVVSDRLGHSGVRITLDTYSHVLPGLEAEAAAQLDAIVRVAAP